MALCASDAEKKDVGEEAQPLRIMLIGKSGAGKSSSGNTIIGKQAFKSDMKLTRVTHCCEKEVGKVGDVPVAVIDTPGLFETHRKKDDVRGILKCVRLQEPGPHAFVFVVPLGRMTLEDQETNTVVEKMFGEKVWDYTIVLFTHGDRLEGKTINDVISESDENLRNFLRRCSGGFHVFNNKNPEDQDQVTTFLAKIQTLMALNGRGHYHTALYPENERKIRERQECILKEREAEISRRERELQEHHQGDELERKKRELWRREEDRARNEAEKQTSTNTWIFLFLALVALMIVWAVSPVSPAGNVLVLLGAAVLGIWMLREMFPTIHKIIPWLSEKTD